MTQGGAAPVVHADGHPALMEYPDRAAFGRRIPKETLYGKSGAGRRLRDLFVAQVEHIVWQYKLAPDTLNLPPRPGVQEIQVLLITLKTQELDADVLRCIDGAVPSPLLFELAFDGRTRVAACYKRPSEADARKWVTSEHFSTGWLPSGTPRQPLPVAVDMGALYEQLLHRLVPCAPRPGESLAALVERMGLRRAKQRELEIARRWLDREPQFNRKVEINARLRQLQQELDELSQ